MEGEKWLVLWVRGGRIGSAPLTEENKAKVRSQFHTSIIQIDASGTEHWDMIGPKKKQKQKPKQEIVPMKSNLINSIHATEKAVNRLIKECHKDGPVYAANPKAAAQVNRTAKGLLNATVAIQQALASRPSGDGALPS